MHADESPRTCDGWKPCVRIADDTDPFWVSARRPSSVVAVMVTVRIMVTGRIETSCWSEMFDSGTKAVSDEYAVKAHLIR